MSDYDMPLPPPSRRISSPDQYKVKEVWASNLYQELYYLKFNVIPNYNNIAFDFLHPGEMLTSVNTNNSATATYNYIYRSVMNLGAIQMAFTLFDDYGAPPPAYSTWQFNMYFDANTSRYDEALIEELTKAGFDFEKHKTEGITTKHFGATFYQLCFNLMCDVNWIAFDGKWQFAYLCKIASSDALNEEEVEFSKYAITYFHHMYDVRYMLLNCRNLKNDGDLDDVATQLHLARIGQKYQAASNSMLTAKVFYRLKQTYFDHCVDALCNRLYLLQNYAGPLDLNSNENGRISNIMSTQWSTRQ